MYSGGIHNHLLLNWLLLHLFLTFFQILLFFYIDKEEYIMLSRLYTIECLVVVFIVQRYWVQKIEWAKVSLQDNKRSDWRRKTWKLKGTSYYYNNIKAFKIGSWLTWNSHQYWPASWDSMNSITHWGHPADILPNTLSKTPNLFTRFRS